ncbi:DUF1254 domain-containing protein [Streptomyces alkaliphilus]|uniref:DUF1254 domain-containing protein n=1 Tax=Streptomyces alkaliphilus TaxID=1472722 RepID=UPI002B21EF87|nr:DUF1254 domain-containing protein [Streptomyces alkaliphilus]
MQHTAQISPRVMESISTPERIETHPGTLEFPLGVPTDETADRLYDHLDGLHAVRAFLDAYSGVNLWAARRGFLDAGIEDHDVPIFSEFMDAGTVLLTGNADPVYFVTFLDLTEGPVVVEMPPLTLGFVNDLWFRWVADPGMPGPGRGTGGAYLFVPPDYNGPLPEGGSSPTGSAPRGSSWAGGRSWRVMTPGRWSSGSGRDCASTATCRGCTAPASRRSSPGARPRRCRGPRRPGRPRSDGPTRPASSRAPAFP